MVSGRSASEQKRTDDGPTDCAEQDVDSVDSRSASAGGGVDEGDRQRKQHPSDHIVPDSR